MTKKQFIRLADAIREYNDSSWPMKTCVHSPVSFTHTQILCLADFCQSQNPRFNRQRWLDYIAGKCGPNGGKK